MSYIEQKIRDVLRAHQRHGAFNCRCGERIAADGAESYPTLPEHQAATAVKELGLVQFTAQSRERWAAEIRVAKRTMTKDEFSEWLYRRVNSAGSVGERVHIERASATSQVTLARGEHTAQDSPGSS